MTIVIMMSILILLRHGQSQWNLENRFTGWTDVDLTPRGELEAERAGELISANSLSFDIAYTSLLKRAVRTLDIVMRATDRSYVKVVKTWRLNERNYGALQGLNKAETAEKFGEGQVRIWRRSYDVRPPLLSPEDERSPLLDPKYAFTDSRVLPLGESLKDTIARVLPIWSDEIAPRLKSGRNVAVVAHGNSLRGLVKFIKGIGDDEIASLEISTGVPYVFKFDFKLNPISASILK